MLSGNPQPPQIQSVADVPEVLCNRNGRDMTARFSLDSPASTDEVGHEPSAVEFRWHRPSANLSIGLEYNGDVVAPSDWNADPGEINVRGAGTDVFKLDVRRYLAAFRDLADAMYLGPFRNAVNVGGAANYYDSASANNSSRSGISTSPGTTEPRTAPRSRLS